MTAAYALMPPHRRDWADSPCQAREVMRKHAAACLLFFICWKKAHWLTMRPLRCWPRFKVLPLQYAVISVLNALDKRSSSGSALVLHVPAKD